MAFAEHEVFVQRDAMTVYSFLLNGLNLPSWQPNIRSISLSSGTAGAPGARYQVTLMGLRGRPVAGDFEITQARPGAEIQLRVVAGPYLPCGGFYLSTEGSGTRVRYALETPLKGLRSFTRPAVQRRLQGDVAQLGRLPAVLEEGPTAG
jgi:uncharacterized membrane protein